MFGDRQRFLLMMLLVIQVNRIKRNCGVLKSPEKFTNCDCSFAKGVLLVGPSGVGKTPAC